MLDRLSRQIKVAAIMAPSTVQRSIGPNVLLASAFLLGVAAIAAVATHFYLAGLALFVLDRALMAYTIRGTRQIMTLRPLGLALDAATLAGMAFGFALADMAHALAASFLILGLFVGVVMEIADSVAKPSMRWVALIFKAIVSFALALSCVWPGQFGIVAYACGVTGFVAAGFAIGLQAEAS